MRSIASLLAGAVVLCGASNAQAGLCPPDSRAATAYLAAIPRSGAVNDTTVSHDVSRAPPFLGLPPTMVRSSSGDGVVRGIDFYFAEASAPPDLSKRYRETDPRIDCGEEAGSFTCAYAVKSGRAGDLQSEMLIYSLEGKLFNWSCAYGASSWAKTD